MSSTYELFKTILNENNAKIFSKNCPNMEIAYNVYGELLKDKKNMKTVLENLKKNKVGWNSPIFNDVKHRLHEHHEYLKNPFTVEEGIAQCDCGSKKTFSYQLQTRSSDEPMTTFTKCSECGKQWVYSG
jgi:DNA-directed RNA polymerase subunit M/transcription elongation factor TFIIS